MPTAVDVLAFYLPQYHPIPENDTWWGAGFTEWTNVTKGRPRFPGHYQPHLPRELGFYDLRVPEVREAQADLARRFGVTAFCYYHYWFHGRRLLQRPFEEVLRSGRPDFPFLLCWANENWTRIWDGGEQHVLVPQVHSEEDDRAHLKSLLPAFEDPRYFRVGGRPMFLVYQSSLLPEVSRTLDTWRAEARRHGIGELHLVSVDRRRHEDAVDPIGQGFDAAVERIPDHLSYGRPLRWGRMWGLTRRLGLTAKGYGENQVVPYSRLVADGISRADPGYLRYPCVTPGWDNSVRRPRGALIVKDSSPELYGSWLEAAVRRAQARPQGERLVFINAWNEWAEGNHLEPDQRWGTAYLEATRAALLRTGALAE